MRIALLQPTYWPEVTRGSERIVHDLAVALTRSGHEVTILTSHPGATTEAVEDGVHVVRVARPQQPARARWLEDHVVNIPGLVLRLLRGRFDVTHAFYAS